MVMARMSQVIAAVARQRAGRQASRRKRQGRGRRRHDDGVHRSLQKAPRFHHATVAFETGWDGQPAGGALENGSRGQQRSIQRPIEREHCDYHDKHAGEMEK